ncbi:hypothetical protein BDA99DRAFT_540965 [Phascolomyces articulosus]|uniref:Uncharacterized protein n=1 Tax=Phascolomyces articulosus TaxID=60185 RepID=A0AAD5JT11_9FUNG|nr:hypothetical protein BDA99DRAFT_540965 [Phascolomyces articulosus]
MLLLLLVCFELHVFKLNPAKAFSDIHLLYIASALNQVFLFVPIDIQKSVIIKDVVWKTSYLASNNADNISDSEIVYEEEETNDELLGRNNWIDLPKSTVPILLELAQNQNEIDVIIANLLHPHDCLLYTTLVLHNIKSRQKSTSWEKKTAVYEDQKIELASPKPDFVAINNIVPSHTYSRRDQVTVEQQLN